MSQFTPIPIELIQDALDVFPLVDDICPECDGDGLNGTTHGLVDCFLCTGGGCEVGRLNRTMTGREMIAFALFMALGCDVGDDDDDASDCDCPRGLNPPDDGDGEGWKDA